MAVTREFGNLVRMLPRQQRRVAVLLVSGLSYREIGERMDVSATTVRNHARAVYVKCGVTGRTSFMAQFRRIQSDGLADLPRRQREVAERVVRGKANATIAQEIGVSHFTIKNHLKALFKKFGVGSRTELMSVLSADNE